MTPDTEYERLTPAQVARIDAACDRFEQAWKKADPSGAPPDLAAHLDGFDEAERALLIRELIALDRAYRERRGVPAADYQTLGAGESLTQITRDPSGPEAPLSAQHIPGCEIVALLGHGGMGLVYKARQPTLDRLVAVKVLRGASVADEELRERFRQEARAAARVRHPNLVQIYEVGEVPSSDGMPMPYLVLEFVNGGSLADALHGTPQAPRDAAQMLEELARAIHQVHEQGVVHRDLKPGNILLELRDAECGVRNDAHHLPHAAIPKIADFGLARLGAASTLTQTGDIVGTPSYMAPEQTLGKSGVIGPATDVYGLGAILYEMLTGRPPFHAETPLATILQVQREEPVSVKRLQPTVPRDLETICLKCLEKEPAKRYASAQALADDLRSFLDDRPILARRASPRERLWRWTRRHPAWAALALVSTLAVLLLAGGGWWAYGRLRTAAAQEEKQRQAAEESFRDALTAVEQLLEEAGDADLAGVPQMEPARKRLLIKALRFYERFLAERGDETRLRFEIARARGRLGDIHELLGDCPMAEQSYRQALLILEQLPARVDAQREGGRIHHQLGILLRKLNHFAEAEAELREALRLRQALVDQDADPTSRQELAVSRYHLGAVLARQRGKLLEAEAAYQDALLQQRELAAGFPLVPAYRRDLARTLNNIGLLRRSLGRRDWESPIREAVGLQRKLVEEPDSLPGFRRDLAHSLSNLGTFLRDNNQTEEAEAAYSEAAVMLGRLSNEFPLLPEYRQELAAVQSNLGMMLLSDPRRYGKAESAFRSALSHRRRLKGLPDYRHKEADTLLKLGFLLARTDRIAEAEECYRAALWLTSDLIERFPLPSYRNGHAAALNHLARLLFDRSRFAEKEQRLTLVTGHLGQQPLRSLEVVVPAQLALVEATRCLEEALQHNRAALASETGNAHYRQSLRNDLFMLANVRLRQGDPVRLVEAAEQLPELHPNQAGEYLVAAQFLARSWPLLRRRDGWSEEERQTRAEACAQRMLALLREAVRRGFKDARELKELPLYEPFRQRDDFRKLIDSLEQGTTSRESRNGVRT
jgi:tetratricopeptide (TPR) repeat protein/tRNA A-37 threonylcarbamoyl transferase component Bud32